MVLEQLADIGIEADVLLEPVRRDSGPAITAFAGAIHWDKSPGDIIEHHPLCGVTYNSTSQSISSALESSWNSRQPNFVGLGRL